MTGPPPAGPGERMSEAIARLIERDIVNGSLVCGDPLPVERELMERHGVSRGVIREAITQLQSRGFLTTSKGSRARVSRPSAGNLLPQLDGAARLLLDDPMGMLHFQEARTLFEAAIVRYAARHATPKQIDILGVALEANRRAMIDPAAFALTDVAFHSRLAEIPNNPIFVALDQAFSAWLLDQRRHGMRVLGALPAVFAQHEAVFLAIKAGDPEAAEAAMIGHLESVSRFYWQVNAEETPGG